MSTDLKPMPVWRRKAIDLIEFEQVPEADVIERATVGSMEIAFVRAGVMLDSICLQTGDLMLSMSATRLLHESLVPNSKKYLHTWDATQSTLYGWEWNNRRVERRGLTPAWKEKAPTGVQSEGA